MAKEVECTISVESSEVRGHVSDSNLSRDDQSDCLGTVTMNNQSVLRSESVLKF